jgi:hypothetical protein
MKLKFFNLISFFAICFYSSFAQTPELNKYNMWFGPPKVKIPQNQCPVAVVISG